MTLHGRRHHLFHKWYKPAHRTGNILYIIYMVMLVTSLPPVRRAAFECFYWLHVALAVAFAVTAWLHDHVVKETLWWCLLLYAADCALRARRACRVRLTCELHTCSHLPYILVHVYILKAVVVSAAVCSGLCTACAASVSGASYIHVKYFQVYIYIVN